LSNHTPTQACAAPGDLVNAVLQLEPAELKPYARGDASGIAAAIDALTGRAGLRKTAKAGQGR
jgi:hypothetical protein